MTVTKTPATAPASRKTQLGVGVADEHENVTAGVIELGPATVSWSEDISTEHPGGSLAASVYVPFERCIVKLELVEFPKTVAAVDESIALRLHAIPSGRPFSTNTYE